MTETDATNTEGNELEANEPAANEPVPRRKPRALQRIVVLGITAGCFVFLYNRLNGAAAREGLSLVDASVMPYVTNGNIYAPVMMIAEKAADLLLGNTPLPPADLPFFRHGGQGGG